MKFRRKSLLIGSSSLLIYQFQFLKKEAACSSETPVNYLLRPCHIQKYITDLSLRCQNRRINFYFERFRDIGTISEEKSLFINP
jgi:hypothetical protein